MIESGDRIILCGKGREYYIKAGPGRLETDLGYIDLGTIVGLSIGTTVFSHKGTPFLIRLPRPPDHFAHLRRSGAPMLPKDIGYVIGATGMNRNDRVLDAGTGSGIAAVYFGGIAKEVVSYEKRPEFASIAVKNMEEAGLSNVFVIEGDLLLASGEFDVVHLDMMLEPVHINHAHEVLKKGGFFASYTPFLEQTFIVIETARELFSQVNTFECIERELSRSTRGTRPSTRVGHSGYITIARK